MSTPVIGATLPRDLPRGRGIVATDRWLYVFMAAMFVAIALGGFIPDSITKLAEIEAGKRPAFPPVMHLHAVVMGGWLMLLLAQTALVATGRTSLHRTLGLASLVAAPAVLAAMIAATLEGWSELYALAPTVTPEVLETLENRRSNVLLAQVRSILYFAVFFAWALSVRKKDSETHKRMMILATVVLIPAAITRLTWLPTSIPASYDGVHAYMLLCLAPVLVHDVIRLGRPHRAYLIGLALLVPWIIATHFLWSSPWWLHVAPKLMG